MIKALDLEGEALPVGDIGSHVCVSKISDFFLEKLILCNIDRKSREEALLVIPYYLDKKKSLFAAAVAKREF
ncbi:hypothetical protein SDC9_180908 [bioreactor metagenome]|uniref:Uncharacterized protein n=1 Tax=bioreactor metagenome TaxID=1076179 RepID=A0A645H312_9ZZZZ